MKLKTIYVSALAASLTMMWGCTKNFEEYNTNPYQPQTLNSAQFFSPMITTGTSTQENDSQHIEQMIGGPYGGYFTMSNSWGNTNFNTYNASDSWNQVPFNTVQTKFYPNYFKVQEFTQETGHYWAMAQILRVNSFHRITDMYGPIPYTKIAQGETKIPYDSQEQVYMAMFEELDQAIETLTAYVEEFPSLRPLGSNDLVYGGDYSMWLRYANSLKLRLAMRLTNVAPEMAQQKAEQAYMAGVMMDNSHNAYVSLHNVDNPYWKAAASWGDTRTNATITSYMRGYADPRAEKYFTSSSLSETPEFPYLGMRSGMSNLIKGNYSDYTMPNFTNVDEVLMFCAAEVAFLRAEGALRGWNMGGTASELYAEGVELSFDQYGVSGYDGYISNAELTPSDYAGTGVSTSYVISTQITIAWDDTADFETNLERIITQKWIANYTLGLEAWADFRRTGYPEIFPAVNNLSNGVIASGQIPNRLRFPLTEYQGNGANVQAAAALLGGADNEATKLWWAKK